MTDFAICVEGLGKRYRIGERAPYRTLREALVGAADSLFPAAVRKERILAFREEAR